MITYQRSPRAIWRATRHLLVVAVPPNPPTRIAGSAALVWTHLAAPRTVDGLVSRLVDEVGAAPNVMRADVLALLAQLEPLGLLEVVGLLEVGE
jgi:hypothetical protein